MTPRPYNNPSESYLQLRYLFTPTHNPTSRIETDIPTVVGRCLVKNVPTRTSSSTRGSTHTITSAISNNISMLEVTCDIDIFSKKALISSKFRPLADC